MYKKVLTILFGLGLIASLAACNLFDSDSGSSAEPAQSTVLETKETEEKPTETTAETTVEEKTTEETTVETTPVETTAATTETTAEVTTEETTFETEEGKEYFQYGNIAPYNLTDKKAEDPTPFVYRPSDEELAEEANIEEGRMMYKYATANVLITYYNGEQEGQFVLSGVRLMLSRELIPNTQGDDWHVYQVDSDMMVSNAVDQYLSDNGITRDKSFYYGVEYYEITDEYWSSKKWNTAMTLNAHVSDNDWY